MVKKLLVQIDKCIGCRAHEVACHRIRHQAVTLQSTEIESVGTLPVVCRHCEEPACAAACPNEAMVRGEDGIVRRNPFRCTGCRSCVLACPFGVLSQGMKLAVFASGKCDLCINRQNTGKEPACVATCPTGALIIEEVEEVTRRKDEMVLGSHTVGYRTFIRRR